jgi:hypothetical protein
VIPGQDGEIDDEGLSAACPEGIDDVHHAWWRSCLTHQVALSNLLF